MDSLVLLCAIAAISAVGLSVAYFALIDFRWLGQVVQSLVVTMYFTFFNSLLGGGRTLGKRVMSLRTLGKDLLPVPVAVAFLRTILIASLSSLFGILGWLVTVLVPLGSSDASVFRLSAAVATSFFLPFSVIIGRGRGLHDLVVGTLVVSHSGQVGLPEHQERSVWLLASRSLALSLAAGMLVVVLGLGKFLELLGSSNVARSFQVSSMRMASALSGSDVTREVHLMGDSLPQLIESVSLQSGVDRVPSFQKRGGASAAELERQAKDGRWLTVTFSLAPEVSRNFQLRELMAGIAARYVLERYEVVNVWLFVNTQASTKFGVLGFLLRESYAVKFERDKTWTVVQPDQRGSIQWELGFGSRFWTK